ncbi:MAG: hypothetical protein ACRDKL_02390 [Solirubrobacteraceae bacterium]
MTHESERYATLFADRTRTMSSSAMRDLMALTAREDMISFSGGLPDTSTFAPGFFTELMGRVASASCARALHYGPTEGMQSVRALIAEVMAAESMLVEPELIVPTSGGRQTIDLVCKVLLNPGDVVITEARCRRTGRQEQGVGRTLLRASNGQTARVGGGLPRRTPDSGVRQTIPEPCARIVRILPFRRGC